MSSPEIQKILEEIKTLIDKHESFDSLLSIVSSSLGKSKDSKADLVAIIDSVFAAGFGVVATRTLVTSFISVLASSSSNDTKISVGNHILQLLQHQAASFEEQNAQIRELMASAYEEDDDFLGAATVLVGVPLDSSQRKVTPEEKARFWIRIVRNYLEIDDTTSAETYLNKFKNVIHQVTNQEMLVHFQLSQARIQDARRDFLAAAKGYQDLSLTSNAVAEDERLHTLSMAIKCAVLAPAGPARSRALKRLYKDERSSSLEEYGILEKMFFDRLIAPEEVAKFAEGLAPHQLAKTADGSTVLVKAMGEHNLLGASRLYSNIGFEQLGLLLGIDGEKAEEMTARMIEQERLVGRIDQIDRVIFFEGGEATGERGSVRHDGLVGAALRKWDSNVQSVAEEVERITSALQDKYPDFVAQHLV